MSFRTWISGFTAVTLCSLLVATSPPEENVSSQSKSEPTTPAPSEAQEMTAKETPRASWDQKTCSKGLLHQYAQLVRNGCRINRADGDLAMTYRALRNVAYAARGRAFKSNELTTLFNNTMCTGAGASKYTVSTDTEIIIEHESEKQCITALQQREKALRANDTQPPKAVEAYILTHHGEHIVSDAKRLAGGEVWGSMPQVNRAEDGSWTITFYQEFMDGTEEDPVKVESSTIIMCTADGNACEELVAG